MDSSNFTKAIVTNKYDSSKVLEGYIVDRGIHTFTLDTEEFSEYFNMFQHRLYELSWDEWEIEHC